MILSYFQIKILAWRPLRISYKIVPIRNLIPWNLEDLKDFFVFWRIVFGLLYICKEPFGVSSKVGQYRTGSRGGLWCAAPPSGHAVRTSEIWVRHPSCKSPSGALTRTDFELRNRWKKCKGDLNWCKADLNWRKRCKADLMNWCKRCKTDLMNWCKRCKTDLNWCKRCKADLMNWCSVGFDK